VISSIVNEISTDLLIPLNRVEYLINSAPYRYKVYQIPKRSDSGSRTIAQPAKEVKRIQYWVMRNIFTELKIHKNATAYTCGKNILSNATPHSSHSYLLKFDFKDFFPSIKASDFIAFSSKYDNFCLSTEDLNRLVRVLFWQGERRDELCLSIGAPSSPLLSNAIMYDFDAIMTEYCEKNLMAYTRYSDDITVSMSSKVIRNTIFDEIMAIIKRLGSPKLTINDRKTVFASKAHRRIVTGLVLTNDNKVSLGRDKKRKIRAQICYFLQGRLSLEDIEKLKGMISYARDVEPEFVGRMEKKYGKLVIMGGAKK
jgi:retron-type reverse transcriptase